MKQEENLVRKIMKSEITWIVMIIGFVTSFFTQVIIPIKTIEIELIALQGSVTSYSPEITQNSNDIIVLQQQLSFLELKK